MRAKSFAEVLDETLRGAPPPPPATRSAVRPLPHGAVQFLFARPLTGAVPRWPQVAEPRSRRPRHALNDVQQRAVALFAELGTPLGADFSADELRRAYRRLAQRYHPDRHTQASGGEREFLARRFAEASASYRCLRALIEPRH